MSAKDYNRREFLRTLGLGAASLAVTGCARSAEQAQGQPDDGGRARPNLLIIHTDQQSCWSLGAYGGTLVKTPHADSLATHGAVFTQFFTNSAVCTPSRGCFLTGRYPHSHGAYINDMPFNRDEITLAHVLRRGGYETGYSGKWHLDGNKKPGWVKPERSMGFDDCRFMYNRGHWKKIEDQPEGDPKVHPYEVIGDENTYTTDWLTGKTIEFIRRPRSKPFFYMVSIPDPHGPFRPRPPYDAMYKPEDMPLPATLHEPDVPEWAAQRALPEKWLRRAKAWYCGEVKLIDDCVGRILRALDEQGLAGDTIVVFTTDHGEYMGEHGLMGKNQLYETAHRIPLLIRWPGGIRAGTAVDRIVSTVDFQPTILALMGVEPSGREQGRDASGLLRGKTMAWGDEAFIHHSSLNRAGIFTPRYELAYVKNGGHILFDRVDDPEQLDNLFHDPEHRQTVSELTERIVKHNIEVASPAASWLKEL